MLLACGMCMLWGLCCLSVRTFVVRGGGRVWADGFGGVFPLRVPSVRVGLLVMGSVIVWVRFCWCSLSPHSSLLSGVALLLPDRRVGALFLCLVCGG